jgi:UDP:flavonoid glycosyltransferase YjiC (YdhE family)
MVALALGLRDAGHQPVLSVTRDAVPLVEKHGLEVQSVDVDVQAMATSLGSRLHNPVVFVRTVRDTLHTVEEQAAKTADGADLVVGSGAQVLASSVCQARGVPYIYAAYAPTMLRSWCHAPITLPWQGLPSWCNKVLWTAHTVVANLTLRGFVNGHRARLGVPPVRDVVSMIVNHPLVLGAFDGHLAHPPEDFPGTLHTTGFWFMEDDTPLAPQVESFLSAGDPPVYVGFGSMPHTNPQELSRVVLEAVAQARVRAVLGAGWTGLGTRDAVPDSCLVTDGVNHAKLFPRVAAAIHHGGAGTTATAARCGIPQVVVPHLLDQFYWGHRVHTQGLGPRPIPVKRLRADNLADAMRQAVGHAPYRTRAQEVARGMEGTHGVASAVARLEEAVRCMPRPSPAKSAGG